MMDGKTIKRLSDEAAANAARLAKRPYVPFDKKEIENYPPFPFPNIGSYSPPGWTEVLDDESPLRLFVDKTGMDFSGPALSIDGLKNELIRLEDEGDYGYAIVEEGEFQIYIGVFKKTGEPEQEEVDEDSVLSEMQYEKQLEIIEDTLSYYVDSRYTASPTPEGENTWQDRVFGWLFDNDREEVLEIVDNDTYMPNLTLRNALPALIDLNLLDQNSDLILRDIDLDGYRLQMWDCQEKFRPDAPQDAIYYRFTHPDGWVIFEGSDFGSSIMHSIDGDETVRALLNFLTLRPGDTDEGYFEDYTKEQKDWAESEAEDLSIWALAPECSCCVYGEEGEETVFKPWG
jgi:hypothetical protein